MEDAAVLCHLDLGSITVLCFRGEKTHDHIIVRQRRIPQLEELLGGYRLRWLENGNQIIKAVNEHSLGLPCWRCYNVFTHFNKMLPGKRRFILPIFTRKEMWLCRQKEANHKCNGKLELVKESWRQGTQTGQGDQSGQSGTESKM